MNNRKFSDKKPQNCCDCAVKKVADFVLLAIEDCHQNLLANQFPLKTSYLIGFVSAKFIFVNRPNRSA